jgi:hypothetical protein
MSSGFRIIYLVAGLNCVALDPNGRTQINPNVMIYLNRNNNMIPIGTLYQIKSQNHGSKLISNADGEIVGQYGNLHRNVENISDKLYIKGINDMSGIQAFKEDMNRPSQMIPGKVPSLYELSLRSALPSMSTAETEDLLGKYQPGGKRTTRRQNRKNRKTRRQNKKNRKNKNRTPK